MKAAADRFAANVLPLIQPLRAEAQSLREIANALNTRGVTTARGGKWAPTQDRRHSQASGIGLRGRREGR
jgi:hypothetical protein